MNNVLCLVKDSRNPFNPGPGVSSDQMLSELVVLHEEMIVQLRRERLGGVATADFIKGMIDQHEKAIAMLRAQLDL
jgi:DNA-binding ferritin-like protein